MPDAFFQCDGNPHGRRSAMVLMTRRIRIPINIGRIIVSPFLTAIMAPQYPPAALKIIPGIAIFQITFPDAIYVTAPAISAISSINFAVPEA